MPTDSPIRFEGDCTIASIADHHRTLLKGLGVSKTLALDLSGVSRMDVTFVQLVAAARRQAVQSGIVLEIIAPSDECLSVFSAAGVDLASTSPAPSLQG